MPYLIVSTPRAGDWNHRTLIAPNWMRAGLALDQLLTIARQQPQGPFWLSVSREVKQKNSEREGQEMLILGDLDVTRLNDSHKRDAILDLLQRRLENDLDALITTGIDWKTEGTTDPVIRREIADWYQSDFQLMNLPESQSPLWNSNQALALAAMKKKASKNKDRNKKIILFAGISSAILLTSVGYHYPNQSSSNAYNGNETEYKLEGNICNQIGAQNDPCSIDKEKRDRLVKIFYLSEDESTPSSCIPEDIEIPDNFKDIFDNFDGKILLSDILKSDKIRKELGYTEDKKITPEKYREIRDYQKKIKEAWTALNNYSKQEPELPDSSKSWTSDNYDKALSNLRDFLESDTAVADDFFNACKENETIKDRIKNGCNTENSKWKDLEGKKTNFNAETNKFIDTFKSIIDLRPPEIE